MKLVVNPAYVLSFLTKGVLYSRPHDVFLRELVQNSLDSITHRRLSKSRPELRGDIRVIYESATLHKPPVILIRDNGLGLTKTSIEEELLSPMTPFSQKSKARDPSLKDAQGEFIGRYGMGLMTAFHVADSLIVTTSSEDEAFSHRVAINLAWKKIGANGEYEPEELFVDHTVLTERPFAHPGTEIIIRLASENPVSLERIKHLNADTVLLGLKYYLRHIDQSVDVTFEHRGHQRPIHPTHHVGEMSTLAYYKPDDRVTVCVGPRTNEPEEVGLVLCVRGILVSLNHPNLLNDLGRALVGEVDIRDTRAINLKPSREECLPDAKFQILKKQVLEAQHGFDRNYRDKKKEAATGGSSPIIAVRHPRAGVMNEESETIQGYLKTYFLTGHDYVADIIFEQVRIRLEAPVAGKRVPMKDLLRHCQALKTRKVFFIYEEEFNVDRLCKIAGLDLWWKDARRFDCAIAVARNRDVIIKLRRDKTRYSLEPLVRYYLEQHGIKLQEMPGSYTWLSNFMEAEPIELKDLPFSASFVRAGAAGRAAYPHPEGIWLNADATLVARWEAARDFDSFLHSVAISFLGFKFETVEKLITRHFRDD